MFSAIVVTHNTRELCLECLDRFASQAAALGAEALVADNASGDDTIEAVRRRFPDVVCLQTHANRGFGAAANMGLRLARFEAAILLNSDIRVQAPALARLAAFLDDEPTAAAVGAGLLTPDGQPQPFACGQDPTLWRVLLRNLLPGRKTGLAPAGNAPTRVDWVSGACCCLRRSAVLAAGGFDERFFLYFEDVDLCLQLGRDGWSSWFLPDVQAVHLGGGSQSDATAARRRHHRSMAQFFAKRHGPWVGWLLAAAGAGRLALQGLRRGKSCG